MDIDRLIAAAKEIDRLSQKQEDRTKRLRELAAAARKVEPRSKEHLRIIAESRGISGTVVNFGDAVNELRKALKARPIKKPGR